MTLEDREDVMVFLADASNNEYASVATPSVGVSSRTHQSQIGSSPNQLLTPSYSEDVQENTRFKTYFVQMEYRLGASWT